MVTSYGTLNVHFILQYIDDFLNLDIDAGF